MEDKNQEKLPLPPLLAPLMKQERKRKSVGEKAETEKKLDQARGQWKYLETNSNISPICILSFRCPDEDFKVEYNIYLI